MSSGAEFGNDELPAVRVADEDEEQCGKWVAKDGERDLMCDLPKGHLESTPCSAPVSRSTSSLESDRRES